MLDRQLEEVNSEKSFGKETARLTRDLESETAMSYGPFVDGLWEEYPGNIYSKSLGLCQLAGRPEHPAKKLA